MAYRLTLRTLATGAVAVSLAAGFDPAAAAPLKSILFVNPLPNYPAWKLGGECVAARPRPRACPTRSRARPTARSTRRS